jgi:phosphoheptose isomerase/fructose-1-phosphate kinase PfkB-like protein
MEHYIKKIQARYDLKHIQNLLNQSRDLNVLILGDTIIDQYTFVKLKGRAIKDPILSTEFKEQETYAGGILAVANHVSSFVKSIKLVTLLGDIEPQREFITQHLAKNITPIFFTKKNSPTIIKRRYIDSYKKAKLFKVEYMNDSPIEPALTNEITTYLEQELQQYDLVIVTDFGHGFINDQIRRIVEDKAKFIALNVQSNSANMGFNYFTNYHKFNFVTIDEQELRLPFSNRFGNTEQCIKEVQNKINSQQMLVTLGKEGSIFALDNQLFPAPIVSTIVKDTVGAGDAVFSITSLLAYLNAEPELVPFIGNCAGALAVNIMGNKESISKESLLNFIKDLYKIEIKTYLTSVNDTLNNINIEHIDQFVRLLLDTYHNEHSIYVFGNGGSAATASHFAGDLIKGVSYGLDKRFKAVCLSDNLPALMAIANDISYDDIFVEQLKNFAKKDDLIIGISGSGNSANVVKALEYANSIGAKTIAICGYKGGKIKDLAHLAIHATINDMEVAEDIHHLVLNHCVKRLVTNALNNTNVGDVYAKRVE